MSQHDLAAVQHLAQQRRLERLADSPGATPAQRSTMRAAAGQHAVEAAEARARAIHARIRANVDGLYAGTVDWDEFDRRNRQAWDDARADLAVHRLVERLVRADLPAAA